MREARVGNRLFYFIRKSKLPVAKIAAMDTISAAELGGLEVERGVKKNQELLDHRTYRSR